LTEPEPKTGATHIITASAIKKQSFLFIYLNSSLPEKDSGAVEPLIANSIVLPSLDKRNSENADLVEVERRHKPFCLGIFCKDCLGSPAMK
jgi:hypothetical protein